MVCGTGCYTLATYALTLPFPNLAIQLIKYFAYFFVALPELINFHYARGESVSGNMSSRLLASRTLFRTKNKSAISTLSTINEVFYFLINILSWHAWCELILMKLWIWWELNPAPHKVSAIHIPRNHRTLYRECFLSNFMQMLISKINAWKHWTMSTRLINPFLLLFANMIWASAAKFRYNKFRKCYIRIRIEKKLWTKSSPFSPGYGRPSLYACDIWLKCVRTAHAMGIYFGIRRTHHISQKG